MRCAQADCGSPRAISYSRPGHDSLVALDLVQVFECTRGRPIVHRDLRVRLSPSEMGRLRPGAGTRGETDAFGVSEGGVAEVSIPLRE